MDLNKHIVTNDTSKPLHSSGFAKIANGDRIGAAGNTSFYQRQQFDRSRQIIDGYQRSSIGNSYGVLRAKSVAKEMGARTSMFKRQSLKQHNSLDVSPKRFNGPSSRIYNPYA